MVETSCQLEIGFECLFSSTFIDAEKVSFENLVEYYLPPVENDNVMLKLKIASQDVHFKSGLEALLSCPKNDFPSIHFLTKLFFTLTVSTASPERFLQIEIISKINNEQSNFLIILENI
ncbi:zinc finger MYM-type protein 1-like [Aphis craccivora]|uniref:Zinc finger MYM-type protein 1-like n=1 Tax=Aphis craccivora TaxID=307492 RepID=A0A6G0YIN8_APHCR|nr:zinc finger MYM-type protein 1-like [Aphis craccivora]